MMRRISAFLCCAAILPAMAIAAPPTIFAAASLKPALDDLAAHGALGTPAPRLVYGASSGLAHQIEQGAPADLFISADEDWMDDLAKHDEVVAATRHDLLGNALVLVAPASSNTTVDLAQKDSLRQALGMIGRLSIALPDSVPAGRYASQSLHALGLWDSVSGKLAMSRDVRAALELVAQGECPLGIVYRSDAVSEPRVRVVATFPEDSHKPIVYPAALVNGHDNAASRALLDALKGGRAGAVFKHYGFDAPSH
ncbi:MAG TPA: molybdate ABC transporter substrate-binding protein [Rhodanobacteraceae bacterium]|nr:molybdate ABC transporter substrate-binding protein [Rhodanobacteraceae bacterium]